MRLPKAKRNAWGVMGLLALAACGSNRGAAKTSPAATSGGSGEKLSDQITQEKRGDEKVTEYDLNHDNKPDVWAYTVVVKGEDGKEVEKLVRKELDINWDGKVDIIRFYDDREQLVKESLDLDFDGRIDQTNYYEKGVIVRKERDLDYNGKPDLWIYYEKGQIVRKERDTKGDGKPHYWEYWENGQVDRIGEDLDGDGVVDRWTKNPNSEG